MSLKAALLGLSTKEEVQLSVPENNDPSGPVSTGSIRHSAVALIIRFNHDKKLEQGIASVKDFIEQEWVDENTAEVLFIKRSTRDTDRWSGHIAFPGGRRDPEDESDLATAKRETFEEVGLDLDKYALYVGPLPQRYVTTYWGGKITMILCTYVFVISTPDPIPLTLQTSEVALAFWLPLKHLTDPATQTRFVRKPDNIATGSVKSPLLRALVRSCVGSLYFPGFHVPASLAFGHDVNESEYPRMVIWGLTHRIVLDFLDLVFPYSSHLRPRIPFSGQWDTMAIMKLFGWAADDEGGFGGSASVWKKSNGKVIGYIVDNYYSKFARAVASAALLRCSIGLFVLIKLVLKISARLRRSGRIR